MNRTWGSLLSRGTPAMASARRRHGPLADRIGVAVALLMVIVAIFGDWLAPDNPITVNLADTLQPPSGAHWLGTDVDGRDVLSRVLAGAHTTLLATFTVLLVALLIGIVVGTAAALGGRVVDEVLMRICDIGMALPALVLGLGLAAALGPSLKSAVIAMAATWWPGYARLVRTVVRETRDTEFVESARALGVSPPRLVLRHILPNSLDVMYIQVTLDVAGAMLVISGLSFVGVGAQAPSPEWGATIAAAADNATNGWWAVVFPGLALVITAVAFNLAGDWLRVRNDPTLRGAGS